MDSSTYNATLAAIFAGELADVIRKILQEARDRGLPAEEIGRGVAAAAVAAQNKKAKAEAEAGRDEAAAIHSSAAMLVDGALTNILAELFPRKH